MTIEWTSAYIISQCFVLVSYLMYIISYQQKGRAGVLVFATIGPVFSTAGR